MAFAPPRGLIRYMEELLEALLVSFPVDIKIILQG